MRLPKNRKVQDSKQNPLIAIGDNWRFKLKKNTRKKVFKGYLQQGVLRYITASKRRKKNGDYETVYFVGNFRKPANEILSLYAKRWNIEKLFRTTKQKLGLQDSQARSLDRQKVHILSSLVAFAIADTIKVFEKLDSPDQVIRAIRSKKIRPELYDPATWRIFYELA